MSRIGSLKELIDEGTISAVEAQAIDRLARYASEKYDGQTLMAPFMDMVTEYHKLQANEGSLEQLAASAKRNSPVVSSLLSGVSMIESMFVEFQEAIEEVKRDQIKILQMIDILCDDKKKAKESGEV